MVRDGKNSSLLNQHSFQFDRYSNSNPPPSEQPLKKSDNGTTKLPRMTAAPGEQRANIKKMTDSIYNRYGRGSSRNVSLFNGSKVSQQTDDEVTLNVDREER